MCRSRLEQEDFSGAEAFDARWQFKLNPTGQQPISMCEAGITGAMEVINPWPTICGDWMWRRPAIVPLDYGDSADPLAIAVRGAIDIFATPETEVIAGQGIPIIEYWSNLNNSGFIPPGIPYNKDRYPDIINELGQAVSLYPPIVRVFAGERQYPMWTGDPAERPNAKYYWDCMFRRYEGRILVAIFVYRVTDPSQIGAFLIDTRGLTAPDFPRRVNLATETSTGSWDALIGSELLTGSENDNPTDKANQWQYPGQWIVDQNGNMRNVQRGRRRQNDAPVRLSARPAELPGIYVNWWETGMGQPSGFITDGVVTDIWFIPTNDSFGRRIIPIYATVQEL